MKPGDHPDFYRLTPPPGASRESTLVLDREGRFWHDGDRIDHAPLEQALRSWIARHPDDGRLILTNGYDWCYFRAEDAAFFVDALRVEPDGGVTLRLFDGGDEPLDPDTLSVDEAGVVRAQVKGGRFEARFSRHAQTQLADVLVEAEPPAVRVRGRVVVIPSAATVLRPLRARAGGRKAERAMHHPPNLVHAVVHTLVSAVSVFIVAQVLPGLKVKSLGSALAFALVVAVLNVVAWTFLAPLTLPFRWLTLGVGGLIFNGVIFLVAARIVGGVKISGCVVAALASVGVTFMNHVIQHLLGDVRW